MFRGAGELSSGRDVLVDVILVDGAEEQNLSGMAPNFLFPTSGTSRLPVCQ